MPNRMELYKKLKERRKILRLTQQQLSDISGVSLRTIKLIEGENGNPSMTILSKICDVLELELVVRPRPKTGKTPDAPLPG